MKSYCYQRGIPSQTELPTQVGRIELLGRPKPGIIPTLLLPRFLPRNQDQPGEKLRSNCWQAAVLLRKTRTGCDSLHRMVKRNSWNTPTTSQPQKAEYRLLQCSSTAPNEPGRNQQRRRGDNQGVPRNRNATRALSVDYDAR